MVLTVDTNCVNVIERTAVLNCGDCSYSNEKKNTSPVQKRRTNRKDTVLSTVKITVLINING
jgi:hypothetical protein